MDKQQFEVTFKQAVNGGGDDYRKARDAIRESGAGALEWLRPLEGSKDWKTALTAETIAGWITNQKRFEQCTEYVFGKLGGRPPITGKFTPNQRTAAVVQLGRTVVPRLLEMVVKTREYDFQGATGAIFGSLIRFRDMRALQPLVELTDDPDARIRELAANTLGELGNSAAEERLLDILRNSAEDSSVRDAAARSLGVLKSVKAAQDLEKILLDKKAGGSSRITAARSLANVSGVGSAKALNEALAGTTDSDLLNVLIDLLAEVGDASSIKELRDRHFGDEALQEAAKASAERIAERVKQ